MITVVAHDAGGAEILSSFVRRESMRCLYVLEGPARGIFEQKLGSIVTLPLQEGIARSSAVLCGTSWKSDLEFNGIKMARSIGKRSTAFIDHWICYQERFERGGEICLPDEIWVGDTSAESLAKEAFPKTQIRVVENPYFEDIKKELAGVRPQHVSAAGCISVLYLCEPLDDTYWGYVEEDALRYFLDNLACLGQPVERIVVRPHPSELAGKYDWVQHEFTLPIVRGGRRALVDELAECDVVVGCETMAMIVGLHAGKRVISCIPPGGKACGLPQPEIEHLCDLVGDRPSVR